MMTVYPSPLEGALFPSWPGNVTPEQRSQAAGTDFLAAPVAGDAVAIAKSYLQQNASKFKVTANDLSHSIVTNTYTDNTTGNRYVYLQQEFNGLPIADAHANVALKADGRVIAANVSFVTGLAYPATNSSPTPAISVQDALEIFAAEAGLTDTNPGNVTNPVGGGSSQQTTINDPDLSVDPIIARLQYTPAPGGGVDLGWQLIAKPPSGEHWFDIAVGASGNRAGQITRVADWVADATYTVFPRPVQDPDFGGRQLLFDPQDTLASPFGWHDTNFLPGSDTADSTGNNVIAQTPGPAPQTAQSPILDFTFPLNLGLTANLNTDAQLTNLFYWTNLAHDISYRHGFDEAAGNFQFANRSGVGIPGDPVIALDQATFLGAPVLNNAFMATPPDGQSPTLAMGIFNINLPANFFRSSSLDGSIILHEYTHGISNRLTGGPANSNALQAIQSGGMGEGWSDWFSLITTIKPGDTPNTPRVLGNWVLNQPTTAGGIRRFPYSFDKSINPLTLGRYNGDIFPNQQFSEVHNSGEIWASALWDMTWMLINKYGYSDDQFTGTGGNNLAMRLVFEGMKLQSVNPDFLDARDAIIAADFAITGGNNYELIWGAFARRGFGVSANAIDSSSLFVIEAFDTPLPLGRVQGNVYSDIDGDGRRDANEPPLSGITVYHDANQNARRDVGERTFVTGSDGAYSITFVTSQLAHIRQDLPPVYTQTFPANNAARVVFVNASQTITGQDFLNQAKPGRIAGFKFNDLNANGAFDTGEPPMARVVVYVDMNNDSKVSILEPSAMTDNFGRYVIQGVPAGTNWTVREVLSPGMQQTMPGPFATTPFSYTGVTVFPNQTTFNVNFANTSSQDFGDAPESYRTTLAFNGPRHGILPGFFLGASVDAELDGQPTPNATGDDTNPLPPDPLPVPPPPNPDDENGIVFVTGGVSPGTTGVVQVTTSTGPASPGRLHAWIDFDQDGTFESNERIIANMLLGAGTRNVSFQVPASTLTGTTFARFRYGYESDLPPTGSSVAGEVEDYQIIVLPSVPVANPDVFSVKENAVDLPLDVLANDPPTIFGPVTIVPGSFPAVLPDTGSTLELNPAGDRILYTAGPGVLPGTQETFTYRVTDGRSVSAPGTVTINVTVADPIALDDTFTLPPDDVQGTSARVNVMLNDVFPVDTRVIDVSPIGDPEFTSLTVDGLNQQFVNFVAPPGFRGTVQYAYTIDDEDPTTAAATGIVTFQVIESPATDDQLRAAGYLAELSVILIDPLTGSPSLTGDISVNQGETFEVLVTSRDLRLGGTATNRGVIGAYLDLLFDRTKVTPISITYDANYNDLREGVLNEPAAGQINDVGASDIDGVPPGQGEVEVFRVLFRATAPTVGSGVQFIGDPADIVEDRDVVLEAENPSSPDPAERSPVKLTDKQAFLNPSGNLVIFGAGEGLFVNRENPLDVNEDMNVTALDVLTLVNNLNATGPKSLVGQSLTSAGAPLGKVDVNMDSKMTALDALMLINFINARGHFIAQAAGEGETASASSTNDASLLGLMELDSGSAATETTWSTAVVEESDTSQPTPATVAASSSTTSATTVSAPATSGTDVDSAAADDLFADLAASRQELRRRYFHR
jgi:hypothetical protein